MSWWRRTQLAWHLLYKEKMRLLVALVGIAFADLLMLMQLGFRGALFDSTSLLQQRLKADLVMVNPFFETLISPQSFRRDLLYRCQAHPQVERVQGVRMMLTPWRNPETGKTRSIQVLGFDPEHAVVQGTESEIHKLKLLGSCLFDRLSRPDFGPIETMLKAQGSVVTEIDRKQIQVVGLYNLGASFAADGGVLCSEETYLKIARSAQRQEIEFGLIHLKSGADLRAVQSSLQQMLGQQVDLLSHTGLEKREEDYWRNSTAIGSIFGMGVVMGFFVGIVIVYQVLHGDVTKHLQEYATLKAMGYSNRFLLMVLAQESLILSVLGYLPGMALSLFLYAQTTEATQLPLHMNPERALGVLGATVAMCCISAIVASRKLASADPAEIF